MVCRRGWASRVAKWSRSIFVWRNNACATGWVSSGCDCHKRCDDARVVVYIMYIVVIALIALQHVLCTLYPRTSTHPYSSVRPWDGCSVTDAAQSQYGKSVDNFSHESNVTSLQDPFTSRPYKTHFYFYYCVPHKIPRGILFQLHVEYSASSRLLVSALCSLRHRVEAYVSLQLAGL